MPNSMSPNSENYKRGLYKTEICRTWVENGGRCIYGNRCQYAHGNTDLRTVPRHPKYKTVPCKAYYETGMCPYGIRCTFLHDEHQKLMYNLNSSSQTMDDLFPNNTLHLQHDPLSGFNHNATIFTSQKMNNEEKESLYPDTHFTKDGSHERLLNDSGFALSESEIEPFIGNGFTDAKTFIEQHEENYCDALDDQDQVFPSFNSTASSLPNRSGRLPIFHKFSGNNNNNNNCNQ